METTNLKYITQETQDILDRLDRILAMLSTVPPGPLPIPLRTTCRQCQRQLLADETMWCAECMGVD